MVKIKSNLDIIYYAHSLDIYNTDKEKAELKTIRNIYTQALIINPNGWIAQNMSPSNIMEQCYLYAGKICNILIFSADNNCIIGKGVYEEIKKGIENHRKVLFMHKEKFSNFSKKDFNNIKMLYNSTGSWKKYAQIMVTI